RNIIYRAAKDQPRAVAGEHWLGVVVVGSELGSGGDCCLPDRHRWPGAVPQAHRTRRRDALHELSLVVDVDLDDLIAVETDLAERTSIDGVEEFGRAVHDHQNALPVSDELRGRSWVIRRGGQTK